MTLHLAPPHPMPAASLDDLDRAATQTLRLLRMWSWGTVHRETLRLAAATQFGAANGTCVVGAFESLFSCLEASACPRLDIRPPDSHRLTGDEAWLLRLTAAAMQDAAPGSAALSVLAAGRARPGDEARLAASAQGYAQRLAACLERHDPTRRTRTRTRAETPASGTGPSPCPIACPLNFDCAEHPGPEVVK